MATRVYGASDDLIEFDGELHGEVGKYNTSEESPVMVAFSDGTVANVWYGDDGVWKIKVLNKGTLYANFEPETDPEANPYSDVLTFKDGSLRAWVDGQEVS